MHQKFSGGPVLNGIPSGCGGSYLLLVGGNHTNTQPSDRFTTIFRILMGSMTLTSLHYGT